MNNSIFCLHLSQEYSYNGMDWGSLIPSMHFTWTRVTHHAGQLIRDWPPSGVVETHFA